MNNLLINHLPVAATVSNDIAIIAAGMLPLAVLLIAAVRFDIAENRIPNVLVLAGMLAGLILHTLLPAGYGFLSVFPGGLGPWAALQGLALGGVVLLPMYLLRVMGAGDVKLMAAVGALLGPDDVLPAVLGTFLAGGIVSFVTALYIGRARQMFRNIASMLQSAYLKLPMGGLPTVEAPPQSVGKVPYGVAIALGTLGGVIWSAGGLHLA